MQEICLCQHILSSHALAYQALFPSQRWYACISKHEFTNHSCFLGACVANMLWTVPNSKFSMAMYSVWKLECCRVFSYSKDVDYAKETFLHLLDCIRGMSPVRNGSNDFKVQQSMQAFFGACEPLRLYGHDKLQKWKTCKPLLAYLVMFCHLLIPKHPSLDYQLSRTFVDSLVCVDTLNHAASGGGETEGGFNGKSPPQLCYPSGNRFSSLQANFVRNMKSNTLKDILRILFFKFFPRFPRPFPSDVYAPKLIWTDNVYKLKPNARLTFVTEHIFDAVPLSALDTLFSGPLLLHYKGVIWQRLYAFADSIQKFMRNWMANLPCSFPMSSYAFLKTTQSLLPEMQLGRHNTDRGGGGLGNPFSRAFQKSASSIAEENTEFYILARHIAAHGCNFLERRVLVVVTRQPHEAPIYLLGI